MPKPWNRLAVVTAAAVAMSSASGPTIAGPIVVSGDANIADALVGNGVAIDPGNRRFFVNVLGRGTRVDVQGTDSGGVDTPVADIDAFYDSLPGVTSTVLSGRVTAASLAGVDLFVSAVPRNAFNAAEVRALDAFSAAGGTLLLLGDGVATASTSDMHLNALLQALGSILRIAPTSIDAGFHTATGALIGGDPLTAGVSTFTYAYTSQIIGGTVLFTASNGQPLMAVTGEVAAVPEPSSAALTGIALAGLVGASIRRRRTRG